MKGFLVDANLSRRVDVWRSAAFQFVVDIDDNWSDSEIWNYATSNDLTILTKDADFANRAIISEPPPKIIHFKIGNMRLLEFVSFINVHWEAIKLSSENHKLVSVYRDRIEVIE